MTDTQQLRKTLTYLLTYLYNRIAVNVSKLPSMTQMYMQIHRSEIYQVHENCQNGDKFWQNVSLYSAVWWAWGIDNRQSVSGVLMIGVTDMVSLPAAHQHVD